MTTIRVEQRRKGMLCSTTYQGDAVPRIGERVTGKLGNLDHLGGRVKDVLWDVGGAGPVAVTIELWPVL